MKKIIMIVILSTFLCGCRTEVERYPIDARYTESYQGIETTYEYEVDIFSDNGIKKMPNTHSKVFPEKYELQYRIKYDNGDTKTVWVQVAKDEYMEFIKSTN